MPNFDFRQVDVFSPAPLTGNPVAVVHDADALSDDQMQAFARWTNLSETTFLLAPTHDDADYRLRIFTPGGELPFAGHPTLGSAHAWLEHGGTPAQADRVTQQCGIGMVELRRDGDRLAFRAPEFLRSGPVDQAVMASVTATLGISPDRVVASQWIDNGPGWVGVVLGSVDEVLAVRPNFSSMGDLKIGIIGAHPVGGPADYEVRAFAPGLSVVEDPVTGSLNAGLAVWLTRSGMAPANYTVRQGTVLGRRGDVSITTDEAGDIWVGGASTTLISGTLTL
jgi:PhzF family phenazine biosynthesis protein